MSGNTIEPAMNSHLDTSLITTSCPYCGEPIELVVDPSVSEQRYVEDCEVCCRPMQIHATTSNDGSVSVSVRDEDSA